MKHKILLVLFLSFMTCFTVSAQKVTMQFRQVKLAKVFDAITQQTGLTVAYSRPTVNPDRIVSVEANDEELSSVLGKLFTGTNVAFEIGEKKIYLKEKAALDATQPNGKIRKIAGVIVDEKGESVIGASVAVQGTTLGTITNVDGEYTLADVPESAEITISFIGYKTLVFKANDKALSRITLKEDSEILDEVVVIGYGSMNKRDVTTSIARVGGEELKDMPVTGFDQALVGKMAGVQITQTTGKPNGGTTIRVRGTGSITAGADPLYVVDGVPLERASSALETVDMNDVESIEILKDASSAAIYGSRGSNGVVMITTKKGASGKASVNYNGSVGFQSLSKKIDMLDAYEFAAFARDGHNGSYLTSYPNASPDDPNDVREKSYDKIPPELFPYLEGKPGLVNTDWQDALYRTAPITKHSITVSGGNDKTKFFISGNYLNQKGIIVNSGYERFGARLNFTYKTDKVELGVNFTPSYSIEDRVDSDNNKGVVINALMMPPVWPVYNEDGSYNYMGNGYWKRGIDYQHNAVLNPVAMANLTKDQVTHANLLGNFYFQWEIIKGLKYKISTAANYNYFYNEYYRSSELPLQGDKYFTSPSNPVAKSSGTYYLNWLVENTLNYQKRFNDHNLNVIVGFTAQKDMMKKHSVEATDFLNDLVQNVAGGIVSTGGADSQAWALASFLARAQYDYKGKYLLSAAIRADGSSRFGKNNRWGYFPSVSVGWRVISEEFMQDINWISNLKLRASYGISGNFNIGNYEHIALLSYNQYVLGKGEGTLVSGLRPSQLPNDDLSWEKTRMYNVGLDVGLFKDRLTFELDVYQSNTYDLLLDVPIPQITGFSDMRKNIGEVRNRGVEFTIGTHNNWNGFKWDASFNIAANRNKVMKLGPEDAPIITSAGVSHAYFKTEVGQPIGNYFLLVQDGIFESQEELDAYPHFKNTKVGDFRFVDVDGNKEMDLDDDRAVVGNYMPKFTYGFMSSFSYKGIDLSFNMQGVQGNKILNLQRRYIANMEGNVNSMTVALDRFQSIENPGNGQVNRANRKSTGNNSRTSTWHLENGSYLRMQNITLGYTLPKKAVKKIGLESLRLYFSGQNLFTITGYSGYNPEVSNYNSNGALTQGVDYGSYPLAKTYSFGLNVSF